MRTMTCQPCPCSYQHVSVPIHLQVLGPLAFVLLLSATPTADSAMFYYQTNELGFTPQFLGQVQLAAAASSLAGQWQ